MKIIRLDKEAIADASEQIQGVNEALNQLPRAEKNLRHCLELFDFATTEADRLQWPDFSFDSDMQSPEERRRERDRFDREMAIVQEQMFRFNGWGSIAASQGALVIYGYQRTRQHIHDQLGLAPALRDAIQKNVLRSANKIFDQAFPDFVGIRTMAAHPFEMGLSQRNWDKHAIDGRILIQGLIADRRYESTYQGKLVGYELSSSSLEALRETTALTWAAFEPIETTWSKQQAAHG